MELVPGQTITEYCDEHQLTPRERLELFLPVCQAIQHAHQKGIIHRDIKPTNILVAEYDQQAVPKVIDFGVAKAIRQPLTEKTAFTSLGQVVGTLEYMSPEQAKVDPLDIDTRSDIYSLGVLLYELLTGTTPFDKQRLRSSAWDEMLRIIREEDPPKPSTRLSDSKDTLPSISAQRHTEPAKLTKLMRGELDWIVMKALDTDAWRRRVREALMANSLQTLEELADSTGFAGQSPTTLELIAVALTAHERPERALEILKEALWQYPGDFWLHFTAAGAAHECEPRRADEEVYHLQVALALRPRNVAILNDLGWALNDLNKPDEAIQSYRRGLEADPKAAPLYVNLSIVLGEMGEWSEAVACSRRAIECDPTNPTFYNNLAWHLATAGDVQVRNPAEALELARKAVRLESQGWLNWNTLSVAAYRAGDWRTSLDARQEKLKRHPIAAEDQFFLAMTHWQLGRHADAQRAYDTAMTEIAKEETTSTELNQIEGRGGTSVGDHDAASRNWRVTRASHHRNPKRKRGRPCLTRRASIEVASFLRSLSPETKFWGRGLG